MPFLSRLLTHARLSRVQRYVGRTVLDVGCGYGELLDFLPAHVESVALLDRSSERLPRLQDRLSRGTISTKVLLGDIVREEIALPAASFDTVVMAALLEHLKSPGVALKQVYRLLQSDGRLVLTTPTPLGGKLHTLGSYFGLTYREAADEHERFYGQDALGRLLRENGFTIENYERFLLGLNQLVVARKAT
ncbi:MAG: class I SAM-dependent methyltransferase [Acidobacteria bacterium]|nr:class I SAM-dependent methyltransferase [Acidobacteriota bacterium]